MLRKTAIAFATGTLLLGVSAARAQVQQREVASPTCESFNNLSDTSQQMWVVGLSQGVEASMEMSMERVNEVISNLTGPEAKEVAQAAEKLGTTTDPDKVPDLQNLPPLLQVTLGIQAPLMTMADATFEEVWHRVSTVCARPAWSDSSMSDVFVEVVNQFWGEAAG